MKDEITNVKHCRACMHYFRVGEHGDFRKVMDRQGFCIMGQCEGDFGLYVSTSMSGDCPAFVLSKYNEETFSLEHSLRCKNNDFRYKIEDARTKEHKLFLKMTSGNKDIQEFANAEGVGKRFWMSSIDHHIKEGIWEVFFELNIDDFKKIDDRWHITKRQYMEFLANLTTEMVNKWTPHWQEQMEMKEKQEEKG